MQEILLKFKRKTIYKNGCWLFIGWHNEQGYGRLKFNGIYTTVSRVSCHIFHGLDLDNRELHALHKPICPNKNCWNPEHLYVGTNSQNKLDERISSGLCKKKLHKMVQGGQCIECRRLRQNKFFREQRKRRRVEDGTSS